MKSVMNKSLKTLLVLITCCFFMSSAQASSSNFPNAFGPSGLKQVFENDWFDYGKNRLKLLRADDDAITLFNNNYDKRKNLKSTKVSEATEGSTLVAKYVLQDAKKTVSHSFTLSAKIKTLQKQ